MVGVIYRELYDDKDREIDTKLQAYINMLHVNYIATGKNTELGENGHGLFGYINNTYDVDKMDLNKVEKYVKKTNVLGNKVTRAIISLSEEEALKTGYTNSEIWKSLLNDKMRLIAKYYDIEFSDLEWVASFHSKHGHPHVHLVFWDKSEYINGKKKKYISYDKVRACINKGIYNDELESLYKNKKDVQKALDSDLEKLFKDTELDALQLEVFSKNLYSNNITKEDLLNIYNDVINLSGKVKNFKYAYQSKDTKEEINKITDKILLKSLDCRVCFEKYIQNSLEIKRYISGDYKFDEEELKIKYKEEIYNKIGNKILQFLKSYEIEKYNKIKKYNRKVFIASKLISEIFFSISMNKNYSDLTLKNVEQKYTNLSKQAKKEKAIEKSNGSEFDWTI